MRSLSTVAVGLACVGANVQVAGRVTTPPRPRIAGFGISPADCPGGCIDSGRVSVLLRIGVDGRVRECLVTETSGSRALDAGTCGLFRRKGRFIAAVVDGRPGEGEYRTAVGWGRSEGEARTGIDVSLPVRAIPTGYARASRLQLEFDGSGRVDTCTVLTSSGSDPADLAACAAVRAQWTIGAPVSGSSEPARAVRFATMALEPERQLPTR